MMFYYMPSKLSVFLSRLVIQPNCTSCDVEFNVSVPDQYVFIREPLKTWDFLQSQRTTFSTQNCSRMYILPLQLPKIARLIPAMSDRS